MRVVLAGDDVRVRDDEARSPATQPEPATPSPHARAEHLHHAARPPPGRRGRARCPRAAARRRPRARRSAGTGRARRSEFSSGPGRRQDGVEPLEDRRALDLLADPVAAGLQRERAEDPDDAEARARRPAPRRGARRRRRSRASRRSPRRTGVAERLEQPGQQRADEQRAEQAERGAYGECSPSDSRSGPIRVPIHAPSARPANASTPATKPWAQPNSASSRTRPDDDPVDARQPTERIEVPIAPGSGPVVRTLPVRTTRASQMCGEHGHAHTLGSPVPRRSRAPPPPGRRRRMASRFAPLVIAAVAAFVGRDRGRRRQRGPAPGRRRSGSPTPGSAATTRRCTRC